MSGAQVHRVDFPGASSWALKRLPTTASTQRYEVIHSVLKHVHESGCGEVPPIARVTGSSRANATVLDLGDDGRWIMSQWMPGRPAWTADHNGAGLEPKNSLQGLLRYVRAGAAAIGRFHRHASGLCQGEAVAPSIAERVERIGELSSCIGRLDRDLGDPVVAEAVGLLKCDWTRRAERMNEILAAWSCEETPIQFVIRDIHRDHVLFEESIDWAHRGSAKQDLPEVTGLIDFDALRTDSPAVDLSRWCSSFLWPTSHSANSGDEKVAAHDSDAFQPFCPGLSGPEPEGLLDSIWDAGLAGYRQIRPLSDRQERLSRDLAVISNSIALANWVAWVVLERRAFPAGPRAVRRRLEELIWLWRTLGAALER